MRILILLSILSLASNCKKESLDDRLTLQRTDYTGNQLRIDGYYYQKQDNKYYTLYILYRNGIIVYAGGGYSEEELLELEGKFANSNFHKSIIECKDNWGVYLIEDTSIKFEKWYPVSDGIYHAYVRSGKILDDTTFVINESYRFQNGIKTETQTLNETYHFKQFSPKPDSTSSFIK